jgi:hypothetical protein
MHLYVSQFAGAALFDVTLKALLALAIAGFVATRRAVAQDVAR